MTTAAARHTNNTIIGSGEVFLDLIEAGEYTGERYLGDSIGASLTVATERDDHIGLLRVDMVVARLEIGQRFLRPGRAARH